MTVVRNKKKRKVSLSQAQVRLLKASLRQLFGTGLSDHGTKKSSSSSSYFLREALDSRLLNS